MRHSLISRLRKLQNWLYVKYTKPSREEIVLALSLNVGNMGLEKGEFVEFSPLPGCCGPFRLEGTFLPVFTYRVFDKPMMEFVKVSVEVSKPDRIHFLATIDTKGVKGSHEDSSRHGEVVACLADYERPFHRLSEHLFDYFPYWRKRDGA